MNIQSQKLPRNKSGGWFRRLTNPGRVEREASCCKPGNDVTAASQLAGKRAVVILYSDYPSDPRPRRELQALADNGVEVDLICIQGDSSQPRHARHGSIRVTRMPIQHQRGGKFRYLFEYGSFMLRVFLLLTFRSLHIRYDLVHVHNMPDVLVFCAIVPKLRGARIVLDLHDPMPELYESIYNLKATHPMVRLLRYFERRSIGFADLAITPNETFKRAFCARSCVPEKMQIVMNTPDETLFRPVPEPAAVVANGPRPQFRVMYHGLIVERHGLSTAVDAVGLLAGEIPELVLEIYGKRNAYLDSLQEQVRQRGLSAQVRYCGWCRLEEIPAMIQASDVGIIPNRRTPFTNINFPTRIFEYLSQHKPVIVPRTRGILDYFKESDILFFKPDCPDDLAGTIRWVYQNREAAAATAQRGRQIYLRYRWSEEKARFLRMIGEVLPNQPGALKPQTNLQPRPV